MLGKFLETYSPIELWLAALLLVTFVAVIVSEIGRASCRERV